MSRFDSIDDLPEHMREQARAQIDQQGRTSAIYGKKCLFPVGTFVESPCTPLAAKPRKYRNEPVEFDGHTFASKWEKQRYVELSNQVDAGLICDLRLQVEFALDMYSHQGPVRVAAYIADFVYRRCGQQILVHVPPMKGQVIEDCKSAATKRDKVYALKRRMFEAQYGMTITEVERSKPRT